MQALGFVDSLVPLYERAACALVPLLSGGGSPLKFVEALAHRVPVVSSTRGAAGLEGQAGRDYLEGDGADGLAAAVLEALEPSRGAALGAAGRALAESEYSIEALAPGAPRHGRETPRRPGPRPARHQRGSGGVSPRLHPMKVVSVMTSEARGGAEYAAVRLLDAVAARGHETVLLTSHPDTAAGTRVAARHVQLGPKLSSRSWPRLVLTAPLVLRRLRGELAAEAPYDVLLLHFKKEQLLAPFLPAALRPRVAWAEWGPVPPPLRGRVAGWPYRRAARSVAAVLAISEGTRRSLADAGVPAERIGVVPNALDATRFRALPEAGAAQRAALDIPADAFVVGCLTRFNVKKRNEVAVDAALRLAGEPGPPVHLLMIGEGETENELRARAAPLGGAAHFVPTTGAEPAELLSGCDVVVFCPSPTEGEPLAISMGMLAERPVVATAAEGATALIEPGTGAIASPDHDAAAVAALLARYRDDPGRARAEGRAARALAAARHDPATVGALAEALLRG